MASTLRGKSFISRMKPRTVEVKPAFIVCCTHCGIVATLESEKSARQFQKNHDTDTIYHGPDKKFWT